MLRPEEIRAALALANVRAFGHVIAEGESDHTENAYRRISGGGTFASFERHPYHGIKSPPGKASGKYQHLGTTWKRIADRYPVDCADFSPAAQEFGYVVGLNDRGALRDVIGGHLEVAIGKLRQEWTSLPGAAENSGRYTLARAREVFVRYGGTPAGIDSQPAVPIIEKSVPYVPRPDAPGRIVNPEQESPAMDPISIGLGLVYSLIQAFAPLARAKIEDRLSKITDPAVAQQVAGNVLDAVQTITGKPDPVAAVADAKQNPELTERAQEATLEEIEKLGPILDRIAAHDLKVFEIEDEGRDRAGVRGRADERDLAPLLAAGALGLVGAVVLGLFAIMGVQVATSPAREPSVAMLTLVGPLLGTIFSGAFAAVYAYRFGTTRNNSLKDITVERLSRNR